MAGFPEGYPVPHPRAEAMGLRVRLEYDNDGDMYAIYRNGKRIEAGIIVLKDWLDRYNPKDYPSE